MNGADRWAHTNIYAPGSCWTLPDAEGCQQQAACERRAEHGIVPPDRDIDVVEAVAIEEPLFGLQFETRKDAPQEPARTKRRPWQRCPASGREEQIGADASRPNRKGLVRPDAVGPEWNRSALQHVARCAGWSSATRFEAFTR
jgi:hypothetical protein